MGQRDWMEKDFYKVLGVDSKASKDEIKRAYRKLAQKYHPDANKGDKGAEQRFKELSEAHSVLSNDDKRREYDQMRAFVEAGGQRFYGFTPGGGGGNVRINVEDLEGLFGRGGRGGGAGSIFEDLFGFGSRGANRQGRDVETEVTLDFDDAVSGTTIVLDTGTRVRIPPGVGDGARIRVPGKGEGAPGSGTPGDLYVRVHVRPHELFTMRKNGDVEVNVPITIAEAALGAKVQVPTPDGSVTVKIPAGTKTGKTLRARGHGAPRGRGGRGDLLAKIDVEIPKRLSRQEKQLLEQFQEIHKQRPRAAFDEYIKRSAAEAS